MTTSSKDYDAILIDTSIFDAHGLRLEKGLLGKLHQFKESKIEYLFPDVIKNEVQNHLEKKVKVSRSALEKALNDAGDHLFFDGSELNEAKSLLIDSKEIEGIANSRVNNFISNTGALVLECGAYVSVSDLLEKYFRNEPPFADTGKKKNEFPDAIILMAVEAWAEEHGKNVLAVAKDGDWESYCKDSQYIDYTDDFSDALSKFNKATAPFAFLSTLIEACDNNEAGDFIENIRERVSAYFDGFTPDQEADSYLYWEPEGCNGWLSDFELVDSDFKIVDHHEDYIVLEVSANITVEAEGEFSFSQYDSIDRDYVNLGGITTTAREEFTSQILITITGDLTGDLSDLEIDDVEIVDPIKSIDFGTIEPNYGEDDYDYM
ncbi:PIN domain-containing protein [Vibrio cholerae]|uniref:PIN domain-containing protein n=1 Tax=Vibrio cholerae TaxID=666 RepID=UPI003AB9D13B